MFKCSISLPTISIITKRGTLKSLLIISNLSFSSQDYIIFFLLYLEAMFLGAYKFRIVFLLNYSSYTGFYLENILTTMMSFVFKCILSDISKIHRFSSDRYLPVISFPILFFSAFLLTCFLMYLLQTTHS